MTTDEVEQLSAALAAFANSEPSWRALALVGSWARREARPNSDVDFVVLTTRLDSWSGQSEWLRGLVSQLGIQIVSLQPECHGVARTWRARLSSDAELEITLADVSWASLDPIDAGTRRVVSDGVRLLADKDALLSRLSEAIG